MPIPNVSTLYQRIAKGSEGGNEFARFMKLLLSADYASQGINFISESDASGDYRKLDAYIPGEEGFKEFITGFQFKFYPGNLSQNQKKDVVTSLKSALKENEFIQEYILVGPEDFMKEQQSWFAELKREVEKNYWFHSNGISRLCGLTLTHWGHTKIIELALKHDHLGCHYFPELYPAGVGKFKLSKAAIDSTVCSWLQSRHNVNGYYQVSAERLSIPVTTDPVFDFQFKNSTNEIHLLNKIEIHIEEVWTAIQGIPKEQFLKSVGTLEVELDFTQPINAIMFDDPFVFEVGSPKRFDIQLNDFVKRCPGNWARIKFWFYFDEITIPTHSFFLSM